MKKEITPVSNTYNVLTAKTVIKGDINSQEDFRIDGNVEGNIKCSGKIIVGPDSKIHGDIQCSNIELFGSVEGNILCYDRVILRATSVLNGEIKTQIIEIEPGAKFIGSCSIIDNSTETTKQ